MNTSTAKSEYALEEAIRERDAVVLLGKIAIVSIGVVGLIAFLWLVFR